MTLRFIYPGEGGTGVLSGALTPSFERSIKVDSARSVEGVDSAGPRFGRRISPLKNGVALEWNSLTHVEARELRRQYLAAANGMRSLWFTPDDGSEPFRVIIPRPPEIIYVSAAVARLSLTLEQQR